MNYERHLNNENIEPISDPKSEVTEEQWDEHDEEKADVTEEAPVPPHLGVFKWG
jgi:hypothetical protein